MCCLQEVRWIEQGARMLGVKGRRYRLWWSGKGYGVGSVGVMVKEELCEKVVKIRRVSGGSCVGFLGVSLLCCPMIRKSIRNELILYLEIALYACNIL